MRRLILFFFCIVAATAFAQPIFKTPYLQAAVYSAQQPEPFSFLQNPAAMAWSLKPQAGFYCEQRFGLAQLQITTAAATLPVNDDHFGVAAQYCGNDAFKTGLFGLAYAKALGSKAAVGALFQYHQWGVAGYGNEGTAGFSLGGQVRFSNRLLVGSSVANPVRFGKTKMALVLPAAAQVGLGYDVSEELFFTTTIAKTLNGPLQVAAACQYRPGKKLLLRMGAGSDGAPFFFGGGFLWGLFRIDVAGSLHPRLGLTPGLQIVYQPKRAE